MPDIVGLPCELHLMITKHFSDPCDLLSLRLTHPVFDTLLKSRFDACFPASVYTRNWPGRGTRPATAESMLHWAARENHVRFAEKMLMGTSSDGWQGVPEYTNIGLHHAACAAARNGHKEMLGLLIQNFAIRFDDETDDMMRDCFDIAVSEENHDMAKYLLDEGIKLNVENRDGKSPLLLVMDAHQVELVDYMLQLNPDYPAIEEVFCSWAESLTPMDGWCQRIVSAVLDLKGLPGRSMDAESVIDDLRPVRRRKCSPQCDVWLGKPKKLSLDELEEELMILQGDVELSSQEAWAVPGASVVAGPWDLDLSDDLD